MAPYAFPHKSDDGLEEVMEPQNTAHYSSSASQPISLLESLNSVLHATKSTDASNNGSQTGSGNGLLNNTPSGQGESEEESDLAVLLALFIPLAATVTAIFIIALFVRRMRRAESMNDVHSSPSNNLDEFQMTPRKKISEGTSSPSSTMSSTSSNISQQFHSQSLRSALGKSTNSANSHQQLDKCNSSASIYCNSSYLRFTHNPLQQQSSLPATGVSHSPTGRLPPWPLAPESGSFYYTRSHYGLNKLHQQLYQHASLQAFSSVQSLNGLDLSRQYSSDPQTYGGGQSDGETEVSSEDSHNDSNNTKKPGNKKLKRVLSAINFPRKIRQYQADRKRFNIYTIPVETREQLKHIYVY